MLVKVKVYFRVYFFICIMAILFSVLDHTVFNKLPNQIRRTLEVGTPLILYDDQEYLSCIDDVLVSNSYVYVLFGRLHLVKVYDTAQNYVCTLIVSDKNSHGIRAQIYVNENTLYISAANDIYEFVDNSFVHFYSFKEDATMRLNISKKEYDYRNVLDNEAYRYNIKAESIIRSDSNGKESVFYQRSPMYFLCNPFFSWLLWVLFFLMLSFPTVYAKLTRK